VRFGLDAEFWQNRWRLADTPWERFAPCAFVEEIPRILDELKLSKENVLVPGCGRGFDAFGCSQWAQHTTGFDLSANAIDDAKSIHGSGVDFSVFDFCEGTPDEWKKSYDVVFDFAVYCALEEKQLDSYLDFVKECIRDRGAFFIVSPEKCIGGLSNPPFEQSILSIEQKIGDSFSLVDVFPCDSEFKSERVKKAFTSLWIQSARK